MPRLYCNQDPEYASSSSSASTDPFGSFEEASAAEIPEPDDPIYSAGHNLVVIRKFVQASGGYPLMCFIRSSICRQPKSDLLCSVY
jgi:hypothetical protein